MTITVKAAEGLRVPMDGAPRKYIGTAPVTVQATAYYLRRLAAGDLVRVEARADNTATEASAAKGKGGK